MIDWINRHMQSPEAQVWINTTPLRNGHNRFIVTDLRNELRAFDCKVAANKYRMWVIEWRYLRLWHDQHMASLSGRGNQPRVLNPRAQRGEG